jgi:hypothetical protein
MLYDKEIIKHINQMGKTRMSWWNKKKIKHIDHMGKIRMGWKVKLSNQDARSIITNLSTNQKMIYKKESLYFKTR